MPIDTDTEKCVRTTYGRSFGYLFTKKLADEAVSRLNSVVAHPERFQQKFGCCGFAAVLMALAHHDKDKLIALAKTVFCPTDDPSAPGFYRAGSLGGIVPTGKTVLPIRKRLEWREQMDFWSSTGKTDIETKSGNLPDLDLSVGLMIFFKEYLKGNAKAALWRRCMEYSRLFTGWKETVHVARDKGHHGGVGGIVTAGGKTQKLGDLALPHDVLQELVTFTFEHVFVNGKSTGFKPKLTVSPLLEAAEALKIVSAKNAADFKLRAGACFAAHTNAITGIFANPQNKKHYSEILSFGETREAVDKTEPDYALKKAPTFNAQYTSAHKTCTDFAVGLNAALTNAFAAPMTGKLIGAIVGAVKLWRIIVEKDFLKNYQDFNLITHWVFLPSNNKVWTYGNESTFPPVIGAEQTRTDALHTFVPLWALFIHE